MLLEVFNLIKPYLLNKENKNNKKFYLYLFFGIINVLINVIITFWFGKFYDAMSNKSSYKDIILLLLLFFAIASVSIVISTEKLFLKKIIIINARVDMYKNIGKTALMKKDCEVVCQRLSQDIGQVLTIYIGLISSAMQAVMSLCFFLVILFKVAAPYVAFICFFYAFIGTFAVKKIAKPLIELDYKQESLEGSLRKELVMSVEKNGELPDMKSVYENFIGLAKIERKLSYFQSIYSQFAVIMPYLLILPLYLKSVITFGALTQVVRSFGQVMSSISFFVDNREVIISLKATHNRLKEIV